MRQKLNIAKISYPEAASIYLYAYLKCQLSETPEIDPSVLMDVLFAKEIVVFEGKDGRKTVEWNIW